MYMNTLLYSKIQRGFVSTLIAGAVGALLTILILFSWARSNPEQLGSFLGSMALPGGLSSGTNNIVSPVTRSNGDVVEVVKRTSPAVVSIVITQDVPIVEQFNGADPFSDFFGTTPFGPFSFRAPQLEQRGTEKREVGGGSGFIVTDDGLIITNRHVVNQENAEYTVFTNDGTKYSAQVIARDPVNDLAVLKIDAKNLPFLDLGSSDALQAGQSVVAIGNALGEFRNTVSVGVISGLSRSITAGDVQGQAEQLEGVIQTDAAINPGNSGGPLLDLNGRVIGVNVAVALGSQSVGFALPVNLVKSVVDSVQKTGTIVRPYIGVRYTLVTPALQQQNRLSVDYGAMVVRGETVSELAVIPGSPADKAGIVEGDIILELDGTRITQDRTLSSLIAGKNVDDTIRLKVLHRGTTKDVSVTLEKIPD